MVSSSGPLNLDTKEQGKNINSYWESSGKMDLNVQYELVWLMTQFCSCQYSTASMPQFYLIFLLYCLFSILDVIWRIAGSVKAHSCISDPFVLCTECILILHKACWSNIEFGDGKFHSFVIVLKIMFNHQEPAIRILIKGGSNIIFFFISVFLMISPFLL